jgi:hypothetical protein
VQRPSQAEHRALLNAVRAEGRQTAAAEPGADRRQDFLYEEPDLPA